MSNSSILRWIMGFRKENGKFLIFFKRDFIFKNILCKLLEEMRHRRAKVHPHEKHLNQLMNCRNFISIRKINPKIN